MMLDGPTNSQKELCTPRCKDVRIYRVISWICRCAACSTRKTMATAMRLVV
jgi:hypothetical protein